MKAVPVSRYIYLGTYVRFLQDATEGDVLHGEGRTLDNIAWVLDRLPKYGLQVTGRAADALRDLYKELKEKPQDHVLSVAEAFELRSVSGALVGTLVAEASGQIAYIATDKRYAVEVLTGGIWSLFRPEVRSVLPEIAIFDLEECGKCIVFERPTAAAFHCAERDGSCTAFVL